MSGKTREAFGEEGNMRPTFRKCPWALAAPQLSLSWPEPREDRALMPGQLPKPFQHGKTKLSPWGYQEWGEEEKDIFPETLLAGFRSMKALLFTHF